MMTDISTKMICLIFVLAFISANYVVFAQMLEGQKLIVGTYNTEELLLLDFQPENSNIFQLKAVWNAVGNHTWLTLNENKKTLLATSWTKTPAIASYELSMDEGFEIIQLRNFLQMRNLSTYISFSPNISQSDQTARAYTVGREVGEVLSVDLRKSLLKGTIQEMNYTSGQTAIPRKGKEDFRPIEIPIESSFDSPSTYEDEEKIKNGAQCSIASPNGKYLFVADPGQNAVWVQYLDEKTGLIKKSQKFIMPRKDDRPRHIWPHPNEKYIYVLQRNTNIVDVFEIQVNVKTDDISFVWRQGARTIPDYDRTDRFFGEEVRTIVGIDGQPEFLVVSTRGQVIAEIASPDLNPKGYVTLFKLNQEGLIEFEKGSKKCKEHKDKHHSLSFELDSWADIYNTTTSGGYSNKIITSPKILHPPRTSTANSDLINKGQYMVLTETQQGLVTILAVEYDKKDKPIISLISQLTLTNTWRGVQRLPSMAIWL